jgi:hypothetical protein
VAGGGEAGIGSIFPRRGLAIEVRCSLRCRRSDRGAGAIGATAMTRRTLA